MIRFNLFRPVISVASGVALVLLAQSAVVAAENTGRVAATNSTVATPDAPSPMASPPPGRDNFALDVGATTLVPLSFGPELHVQLPAGIFAQVHLGWMPDLYSDALTDGLQNAGVYDATVGALVNGSFEGATTWRLGLGYKPFANYGLELGAAYVHVSMEGATNTTEVMAVVPPEIAAEIADVTARTDDVRVNLDSSLHHMMLHVGWCWLIAERFTIAANLGYLQAIGTSSELEIEAFPRLSRLATPIVDDVLHEHYMRYVKIPVVGLGVGYRFF
jgi:hypothetical protein